MRSLPMLAVLATAAIGSLTVACTSTTTSSRGQMITCTTDPGTAVILSCEPGAGSGGSNECHDVDEDGDGDCHDSGAGSGSGSAGSTLVAHDGSDDGSGSEGDSDGDGVPDTEDCDNHPGEDDDGGDGGSGIDLPYDVSPQLGATTTPIADAFAEEGGQPAAITSVTMDGGGTWRLAELQAGTAFVVTADDCTHAGNRDIGRDRVVVTWQDTAGGVTRADHLDIRYCK